MVVVRVADRTPRLRRLTLGGPALAGFPTAEPAASVRLLPPTDGAVELPAWNGNEWLFADGRRPPIRTLTPVRIATDLPGDPEVDVDVVLHGAGPLATWAATAEPGAPAALAGVGQGYELDPDATHLVLAGDESALPAIEQLLGVVPHHVAIQVVVELAGPDGRLDLPEHPSATVVWCDDLVAAVRALEVPDDVRVWAAGNAAEVQRIRRYLFEERGLPRPHTVIRGYWK